MSPIRSAIAAAVSVVMLVLAPVLFFANTGDSDAQAAEVETCPVVAGVKDGNVLTITACGQVLTANVNDLANGTLLEGAITLPTTEISIPGPTVTIPGPKVTIRPPRVTETVRVPIPGPTRTVTERVEIPGPTATVTRPPIILERSAAPQPTVTVTASPTGQPTPSRATVTPSPEVRTETETETRTVTETIIRNVLIGTLALLVLAALGVLALWLGYILGYKGAERNEVRSLRNMLDMLKGGGKHS